VIRSIVDGVDPNGSMGCPFPNLRENGSFQQRLVVYTAMSMVGGGWSCRMWSPSAVVDEYVVDPTM